MSELDRQNFTDLMTMLASTTKDAQRLERYWSRFEAAWLDSPAGFAHVVAEALQFGRDPVGLVIARVLANDHKRSDDARPTNVGGDAWLVAVEREDGVRQHRFASAVEAAEFVERLEGVTFASDADPLTRSICVEVVAPSGPESPARTHEAAA